MDMTFTELLAYIFFIWLAWQIMQFFLSSANSAKKERERLVEEKINASKLVFRIEPIDDPKHGSMILIFNSATNKFIGQSTTPEGVLNYMFTQFKDKNIFMEIGEGKIVPLIPPNSLTSLSK
jgi:hypothetical protein